MVPTAAIANKTSLALVCCGCSFMWFGTWFPTNISWMQYEFVSFEKISSHPTKSLFHTQQCKLLMKHFSRSETCISVQQGADMPRCYDVTQIIMLSGSEKVKQLYIFIRVV
jgi:hypothetical protein